MVVDIYLPDKDGNFIRTRFPAKFTFRKKSLVVPAGFKWDGASVPRVFRPSVFSPIDPEAVRGSCGHDWIYETQPEGWTRAEADLLFLCCLLEDGAPVRKALKAYIGVRLFGWIAWRQNKELAELNKLGD